MTKGIESSREPLVPPQVELEAFASSVLSLELQLLEQHKGAIGGEPGLQRAHRVIHMAPALAEGNVGIDYYAGYLLHRIYAHSSDKLIGGPTRRAIGLYIGILEDQPDKLKRVFGSISDFEEIEKTANIHRTQIQTQDKTVRGLLDGTYKGVIPEDTWKAKVPITDPVHMLAMLKGTETGVNIESVALKSIEKLDIIMYEAGDNPETFRLIQEINSFYAPLCEFLGYKPLAMALRSRADLTVLRNSGRHQAILRANEAIDKTGDIEEARLATAGLLSLLIPGETSPEVSQTGTEVFALNIACGEIAFERKDIGKHGVEGDGDWRRKSVGGWALKLSQDGYETVDTMGITLTTRGTLDLVRLMRSVLKEARNNPKKIEFISSQSRAKGEVCQVRGKGRFVNVFLGAEGINNEVNTSQIEVKRNNSSKYQVAKTTLRYLHITRNGKIEPYDFEVQFQTLKDYRAGKYGRAAHGLTKSPESEEVDEDTLAQIALLGERKTRTGSNNMLPASLERGQRALDEFRTR